MFPGPFGPIVTTEGTITTTPQKTRFYSASARLNQKVTGNARVQATVSGGFAVLKGKYSSDVEYPYGCYPGGTCYTPPPDHDVIKTSNKAVPITTGLTIMLTKRLAIVP